MKAKDVVTLRIESYGMEGEGVSHVEGFTFFVPCAMVGEEVKVAVDKVKGNLVFAHIIKMIAPSPERMEPCCPLFGKCGGCALRHLPYKTQLAIKRDNVLSLFKKNAGEELSELPIYESDRDGYRNKIALPFGTAEGEPVLGMYKRGTHKVLSLTACPLHGEWIEPLIREVLSFVKEKKISVYDQATGKGLLRNLAARRLPTPDGWEYGVILVVNGSKLPDETLLADRLSSALPGKVGVYLCKNTAHNNVILSSEIRTIRGGDHIRAELCGGVWEVSPLAFLQVNFPVAESIYTEVVQAIPQGATVVDAYSGTGIMTALIAKKAKKVVGIESIPDAVKDANANAVRFGVGDKVTHLCGQTEELLPNLVKELGAYTLVVDPPRAGLDKAVVDTLLSFPPQKIIYVSCSPATLTRDLRLLKQGFSIEKVKLFDMFPQTPHVETVVLMSKAENRM